MTSRLSRFQRYWFLWRKLQNPGRVISSFRRQLPVQRLELRNGLRIDHDPTRAGLVETFLEIWYDEVYRMAPSGNLRDGVILDAGAHIGIFSLWAAKTYPSCRVIAFEPFPENFKLLCQNVQAAGCGEIEAHNLALGGDSGLAEFHDGGARSLDHRIVRRESAGADSSIRVISLQEVFVLVGNKQIDLFKVDIEGSEMDLFAKADTRQLEQVDRFAIEYHDNLRPGTLAMLSGTLLPTHDIFVQRMGDDPYGMLYAVRRNRSQGPSVGC